MRLPRSALLDQLAGEGAPGVALVEAPTGFGKSWLLRQAAPPDAIRLRADLGALAASSFESGPAVIIDDAHLLTPAEVARLIELVEDAPATLRLIVSGRILSDELHHVVHLVDGMILDAAALSLTPDEIVGEVVDRSDTMAAQLAEAADGSVKVIATVLQQWRRDPRADPIAMVARIVRSAGAAALNQLDSTDRGLVGLLAKAPGIDQTLLVKLGGPGFVGRALAAGIPLRRQVTGGIDLVAGASFKTSDVDAGGAIRLADALVDRDRPIEAIGLLLDAGAHDRAARMMLKLPESVSRTVEPRALLALLARLGTLIDREPGLLLIRAGASSVIGQFDSAGVDIDKAMALVATTDSAMGRRIRVEAAERLLLQGRRDEAARTASDALGDLGPGEDHTFARAHVVLADAATMSDRRESLQEAAEFYRIATAAWEACGESARARLCRCDLATAVLVPLGRFDEALAQLAQILSVAELSDTERAWMVLNEGFVLYNANRLDSAEARFGRVADLGYLQDNPRIIAASAWGRALIATRRDDRAGTLRWISIAENTALAAGDDALGVPFLCDTATALGALGELELAERQLARAKERAAVYADQVGLTEFILDARRGVFGDVAKQLSVTAPAEWWRVQLVSALSAARLGDLSTARIWLAEAERELQALGFGDFASLGERRTGEEITALLREDVEADAVSVVDEALANQPPPPLLSAGAAAVARRLRVIGGPVTLEDGSGIIQVPPGNPQRLVGAVVAHGGSASFDQLSEAMWPGDDVDTSRSRLRNVLLRLRRAAGDVVVRSGTGVRLAADIGCDLYEFQQMAADAASAVRTDPDVAGQLAAQAVGLAEGPVFGDFEYEEWAVNARRSLEIKLIGLLDLLSVQAEDAGDLARAQSLAERALRLDRYSDSRYVRLAELLTLQGRSAAAVAVLEDAAEVAREIGAVVPSAVKARRDDLLRRAASG